MSTPSSEAASAPEAVLPRAPEPADPTWVTISTPRPSVPFVEPVRPRRVLLQLLAALAAVIVAVGTLGAFAAHRLAERESVNDAAKTADVLALAVITPALRDSLLDVDPTAVAAMDAVVRERILGDEVVRVKLWAPDGTVVYADEPQLVGRRFSLTADQRNALAEPRTTAEVSDLRQTENQFEEGPQLLEVYRPVWTPTGHELLFETYTAYDAVQARSGQLWRGFAGVTLSSLLLLVVLGAPIMARLLHRLGDAQRHRERVLERTLAAGDAERRRIAATLHDGPVQELIGTSYAAAAAAERADREGRHDLAGELRGLATGVRRNAGALRSLLVEIYPETLSGAGLANGLGDLAATATGRGVTVQLDLDEVELRDEQQRLVYRVALETLRNTATHAAPCTATVRLGREDGDVVLDVIDDGPGLDVAVLENPEPGHFGLRVLGDLASDAGATLQVASSPGHGTHWRLVLPGEEESR